MANKKGSYLIFGGILGFILGLLFAPKKGEDLRVDIKEKVDEIKENPNDVLRETTNLIKDKVNSIIDLEASNKDIEILEEDIVISKTFNEEE